MSDGGHGGATAIERFFQASPSALCTLAANGRLAAINPAGAALLGWSVDALIGQDYEALLHPDDVGLAAPARRGAEAPAFCDRPHAVLGADGRARRIAWQATAEGVGPDRLIHAQLTSAEDDGAEDAAWRESLLAEHGRIGIWTWGGDGTVHASAAAADLLGLQMVVGEVSTATMLACFEAGDGEALDAGLLRLDQGAPFELTLEARRIGGPRRWLRVTARPQPGMPAAVGIVQDITEVRLAELRLQRLTAVAETTTNAVLVIDRERQIRWVNRAFTMLTGYAAEEAIGRVPSEVLHSDETDLADANRVLAAIKAGEGISLAMQHRAKDGRRYWAWVEVTPTPGPDGRATGFVVMITDITERRASERRLVAAEAEARAARTLLVSAIEALPDGFVLFDADERLILCNERYRQILPEITDFVVPGARMEDLLRTGLALDAFPEAVGREEAWLADRLTVFRKPQSTVEIETRAGRHIRSVDRQLPGGGHVGLRIDITGFRRSEERLRAAEAAAKTAHDRLLTAIEALPHGFVFFDEDERLVIWNSRFRDLLGPCAHMAVQGTRLEDLVDACIEGGVYPDIQDRKAEFKAERMAAEHRLDQPQEQRIFDGRWMRIVDVSVPGGGRVGLRIDVTEEKTKEARLRDAERQAREANELLSSAVDVLPDGFVLFDRDRRLITCNEPYRNLVRGNETITMEGKTIEELMRNGLARGAFPIAEGREDAFIAEQLARFERSYAVFELELADGRWIRAVDKAMPNGGKVGLRIDVTESKRNEARLREAERRAQAARSQLLSAVDTLPDAFAFYDGEDRLVVCNERYRQYYSKTAPILAPGVGFEEMLRYGLARGQFPDAVGQEEAWLAQRLADHRRADREVVQRLPDDQWVRIVEKATPDGGRVGLRIDITELKRQQAALEIARERAEAANRTKSLFLANMSHEIRTPMNGVMAMAEILHGTLEDPEKRALVGVIRESGEALMTILNDILDFSKIEANRLELECVAFTPHDVARRVESLHALKAAEKGIGFSVERFGDGAMPRAGDPHRILQILHNLVSNAIKFTEEGRVSVVVDATPEQPLRLTITDTGIGMSEAQLARLFDAFVQADNSTTRRFGGTGLGMAIVKRLVEAMAGTIEIESRPKEGTRILVSLPVPPADQVVTTGPPFDPGVSRWESASGPLPSGLRVLAADDNRTNRSVMAAMLQRLGVEAVIVASGAEAVVALSTQPFDLLMLDISMPGMDGIATLQAVRVRERELGLPPAPAIAVTANALKHQVQAYCAQGFDGHVAKPVRASVLADSIRRHVSRAAGLG
ncbi:MAG: PAS-domain containing protein [Pseudomonadota bacterium]